MSRKDLVEHLAGIVKEAQDGLERFKTAIAQGAFPRHDISGVQEITERRLKEMEAVCAEYRRLMRQHFRE